MHCIQLELKKKNRKITISVFLNNFLSYLSQFTKSKKKKNCICLLSTQLFLTCQKCLNFKNVLSNANVTVDVCAL